jgi:SAM-dependent methyltransferase
MVAEPCGICEGPVERVASFDAPPPGEPVYGLADYHRELWSCLRCRHVWNRHAIDLSGLYLGPYREVGYGQLAERFERIMALPPERSDNRLRIARVDAEARRLLGLTAGQPASLLDVGSGLAVFPAAMKDRGWRVTALDPDPVNAEHARLRAGAEAITGDFFTARFDLRYDLISLNRVLEHVVPMRAMLERAASLLNPGGVLYVEVPDGEIALADGGPGCEEFFVDHYGAFSVASLALLAASAGLRVERLERCRDPSGKYTLYAFCRILG